MELIKIYQAFKVNVFTSIQIKVLYENQLILVEIAENVY